MVHEKYLSYLRLKFLSEVYSRRLKNLPTIHLKGSGSPYAFVIFQNFSF